MQGPPRPSAYAPSRAVLNKPAARQILSELEWRFVDEYLIDTDAVKASFRAGFKQAEIEGPRLLKSKPVLAAIAALMRRRSRNCNVESDSVLQRWAAVYNADPREYGGIWKVACRYCWGIEHQYQFTDIELLEASREHELRQRDKDHDARVEFDDLGGGGYTINREPMRDAQYIEFMQRMARSMQLPMFNHEANSDHACPECHGHGIVHEHIADVRYVSPEAALLFEGFESGKNGPKVILRKRSEVETLLARHLGMLVERKIVLVADVTRMGEAELRAALEHEDEQNRELLALEHDAARTTEAGFSEAD